MLVLQAVPVRDGNAFTLLRARIREASTWNWANKKRTRLRHVQRPRGGDIQISDAGGVLVAHIRPKTPNDLFYLAEKFTGRLIAWFERELVAINVQFMPEAEKAVRKKRKAGSRKREAGRRRRKAGGRKREAGRRKREAGRRKRGDGRRKPEAGSRKREAGRRKRKARR